MSNTYLLTQNPTGGSRNKPYIFSNNLRYSFDFTEIQKMAKEFFETDCKERNIKDIDVYANGGSQMLICTLLNYAVMYNVNICVHFVCNTNDSNISFSGVNMKFINKKEEV